MLSTKYKMGLMMVIAGIVGALIMLMIINGFKSAADLATKGDLSAERKILFWYDPMYPNTKFDKPGPSPFMDMDLMPKYADEGDTAQVGITINPTQVQNLGVKTDIATLGTLTYQQWLPANIDFNDHQYATVQARASGFVEKSYPLAVGDYVQKGDALIDLTVTDWIAAQSEYLTLLKSNVSAKVLKGAYDRLYLLGMPKELLDKLQQTKQIQSYLTIRAPISGVLTSFDLREGMNVDKSMPIATIQGIDPIWITASVPQSMANQLTSQSTLSVSVPAFADQQFTVKNWLLLPSAESNSRTLTLRLQVDNQTHQLKPGMTGVVNLQTKTRPYLIIPSQAIIDTGHEQHVITQTNQGQFVPKIVQIYAESAGQTAILSGLEAGEQVVTSGLFLIDSEANINGALDRMRQQTAHNDVDSHHQHPSSDRQETP